MPPCPIPRLVALVQAPAGSMWVWLRGDRFGIEGQWDYNDDPVGQEWCWSALSGKPVAPLPTPFHIEHVDPDTQSALNDLNQASGVRPKMNWPTTPVAPVPKER